MKRKGLPKKFRRNKKQFIQMTAEKDEVEWDPHCGNWSELDDDDSYEKDAISKPTTQMFGIEPPTLTRFRHLLRAELKQESTWKGQRLWLVDSPLMRLVAAFLPLNLRGQACAVCRTWQIHFASTDPIVANLQGKCRQEFQTQKRLCMDRLVQQQTDDAWIRLDVLNVQIHTATNEVQRAELQQELSALRIALLASLRN